MADLRAPFPYFGGKSRAAEVIWSGLGPKVPNYVSPFGGSLAVELLRPGGPGKIETVNDLDCDAQQRRRTPPDFARYLVKLSASVTRPRSTEVSAMEESTHDR